MRKSVDSASLRPGFTSDVTCRSRGQALRSAVDEPVANSGLEAIGYIGRPENIGPGVTGGTTLKLFVSAPSLLQAYPLIRLRTVLYYRTPVANATSASAPRRGFQSSE
jgi:hypothetical protein